MQPTGHRATPVIEIPQRQAATDAESVCTAANSWTVPVWRSLQEVAEFVAAPSELAKPIELTVFFGANEAAGRLVTISVRMSELLRLAQRMAQTDWPVLIQGETGTGKELLARLIHHWSDRRAGPFIAVNCAALPETLAESELFGCERGSYTGAGQSRPGYWEQAHGGTLILDEVSELPWPVQGKLLRVLEEQRIYRLGATQPRSVSVRLVALSNRPLETLVQQYQFRADLFHRLSVLQLRVPALRDRPEDIPLLAEYFLQLARIELGRPQVQWSTSALQALQDYPWPGNVRQLRNVVWQVALHLRETETVISPEHLSVATALCSGPTPGPSLPETSPYPAPASCPDFHQTGTFAKAIGAQSESGLYCPSLRLAEIERFAIAEALRRMGGRRRQAAELLGISLRTLFNKLRRYGLASSGQQSKISDGFAGPSEK